jgi:hypothetical protein
MGLIHIMADAYFPWALLGASQYNSTVVPMNVAAALLLADT